MSYSSRLKTDTAGLHQMAESSMYAAEIMEGRLSVWQYKMLISVLFKFHLHAENAVLGALEAHSAVLEPERRRKLPHLRSDLQALGITEDITPSLGTIAEDEALGWLYVMEGATLGGQVIVRKLMRVPGLASLHAMNYYEGYGPYTGEMWNRFKSFLDSTSSNMQYENILAGATRAYGVLLSASGSTLQAAY